MPEYDEAYYIDRFGLALLLDRKGQNRIYCLDVFSSDVYINDDEACHSLFSMVDEGLVNVDENEEFDLSEGYEKICELITQAQLLLAVYSYSSSKSVSLIYVGKEKSAFAEPAKSRKDTLRIFEIKNDDIDAYIKETIHSSQSKKTETLLFAQSLEFLGIRDSFLELSKNPATDIVIDFILPEEGRSVRKCSVINVENEKQMCIWEDGNFTIKKYEDNNIFNDFRRKI